MAISVYSGTMGSGKSYEAVSEVIVPAIAQNRRVVTNIEGINQDLIKEYIAKNAKKYNYDKSKNLGEIVYVEDERVSQLDFFPDEKRPDAETVVKYGDLVVIDEAWRFWEQGSTLQPEHEQFFRMHRHYTHPETGVSCDLVILTQDLGVLQRKLKAVVSKNFLMKKHTSLGLSSRYRVQVFEGYRQTKQYVISTYQKKYDKKIFPLYQSYKGTNGTEKSTDKRASIWRNSTVLMMLVVVPLLLFFCANFLWSFFHPEATKKNTQGSVSTANGTTHQGNRTTPAPLFSPVWRIVGRIELSDKAYVVVASPNGRVRYEPASNFLGQGQNMVGKVDGDIVTYFSGSSPTGQAQTSVQSAPTQGAKK